jgi:antitoxin component YwqK of YwqJK toxin-antitoxin module
LVWDANGRLRESGWFADGRGVVTAYDSLGRRTERRASAKGQPEGETWGYHPDGGKKSRIVYGGGQPLSVERWHANGRLAAEGRFEKGKRTGEWKQFDAKGRPKELARYENGLMHGERRLFDSTGKLSQVQRYEHGYPAEGRFPGGLKDKFRDPKP